MHKYVNLERVLKYKVSLSKRKSCCTIIFAKNNNSPQAFFNDNNHEDPENCQSAWVKESLRSPCRKDQFSANRFPERLQLCQKQKPISMLQEQVTGREVMRGRTLRSQTYISVEHLLMDAYNDKKGKFRKL